MRRHFTNLRADCRPETDQIYGFVDPRSVEIARFNGAAKSQISLTCKCRLLECEDPYAVKEVNKVSGLGPHKAAE